MTCLNRAPPNQQGYYVESSSPVSLYDEDVRSAYCTYLLSAHNKCR